MVLFLTKSTGVLGPIASVLGLIMNGIYEFFHLFGIQNIALSIIVFTFITKTLMLPLTIKQQKFTKLSSRMNPELQKIQAKYKGKKDEASLKKQQTETQVLYQKYGASPTSGCLPILITLPIMFALYSVINNIPAYVNLVKDLYEPVAEAIKGTTGFESIITTIGEGTRVKIGDLSKTDNIINVLAKFKTIQWDQLKVGFPNIAGTITESATQIKQVNGLFGLNIIDAPGWKFPGIIIPFLAMALQFVQSKQLNVKNKDSNKETNSTASAMSSMTVVMPIMSGVFCITLPTGVGLYWIATSVYAIIQQYFVNKYMDHVDLDELIKKNVLKASKKPSKLRTAGTTTSLQELAKKQTKSIESSTYEKGKGLDKFKTTEIDETALITEESEKENSASIKPSSISDIANLLKNRNSEKGDK